MSIEETHLDTLQNLEYVVVQRYREHPELTDRNIQRVYTAVIDSYAAEHVGRQPRDWRPEMFEAELYKDVVAICEIRLGRTKIGSGKQALHFEPLDRETLIRCLKRLQNSVQRQIKLYGGRGYLDLITQFTP